MTSVSSMGDEERREWRGVAAPQQDKQEPREVGTDLMLMLMLLQLMLMLMALC